MPRPSNSSESSRNRRGSSRSSSTGKSSSRGRGESDRPFKKSAKENPGKSFSKRSDDSESKRPYSSRSESPTKRPFKKFDGDAKPSFRKRSDEGSSDDRRRPNRSEGSSSKGSFRKFDDSKPTRKRSDGFDDTRRPSRAENAGGKRPYKKFDSDSKPGFRKRSDEGSSDDRRGSGRSENSAGKRPFKKFDSDSKPGFRKRSDEGSSDNRRGSGRSENSSGKRPFKKFDGDSKPGFRKRSDEGSSDDRRRSTRSDSSSFEKRPYKKFDSKDSDKPFRRKRDEGSDENKSRGRFSSDKSFDKPFKKFDKPRSAPRRDDDGADKRSNFKSSRPVSRKSEPAEEAPTQTDKIRLNKYISNSGVCSRREADELIKMGLISVNGKVITELGYKVNPGDEIRHESRVLKAEKPVYILMNKPKGFLTTTKDPEERNTVMQIIGDAVKERIYPVGRLDRNTTGLLLLTNDGDLADKLMHPSYNAKKIYKVELDRPLTKADFQKILDGVQLEEGKAMVDDLAYVSDDGRTIGVEIHIGWNRVVRRIFESLTYDVVKLDRSVYAGLDKKDLQRGHWRFLSKEEVVRLKHYSK